MRYAPVVFAVGVAVGIFMAAAMEHASANTGFSPNPEGCVTSQERARHPHYCLCMMIRYDQQFCRSFEQ